MMNEKFQTKLIKDIKLYYHHDEKQSSWFFAACQSFPSLEIPPAVVCCIVLYCIVHYLILVFYNIEYTLIKTNMKQFQGLLQT